MNENELVVEEVVVEEQPEKTFNQEQVDNIVAKRLKKERKEIETIFAKLGIEDVEKIDEFIEQLNDERSYKSKYEELSKTIAERDRKERVIKAGIDERFVKVALLELGDEFDDETLQEYVQNNIHFTKEKFNKVSSSNIPNGTPPKGPSMKDLQKL